MWRTINRWEANLALLVAVFLAGLICQFIAAALGAMPKWTMWLWAIEIPCWVTLLLFAIRNVRASKGYAEWKEGRK